MKDNNGRGIFYGVIGVATLVVAIIGATFAFFSAQVTSENAIANIASATVGLDFETVSSNFKKNLIPVDTDAADVKTYDPDGTEGPLEAITAFAQFPGFASGNGAGTCRDLVGNDICSIYVFKISNPGTSSQTVVGSVTVNINGSSSTGLNADNKFTDLKYALFVGDGSVENQIKYYDTGATTSVNETVSASNQKGKENPVVTTSGTTQTVKPAGTLVWVDTFGDVGDVSEWTTTSMRLNAKDTAGDSVTYTMVIWLEDDDTKQDTQQDVSFAASITFRSPEGGGVTGVITAG